MVVIMTLAILVGFIAMGFTAKAASDITAGQESLDKTKANADLNDAHKDATIAAVLGGIVSFLILVSLFIYMFRKEVSETAQSAFQSASQSLAAQNFGAPKGSV